MDEHAAGLNQRVSGSDVCALIMVELKASQLDI